MAGLIQALLPIRHSDDLIIEELAGIDCRKQLQMFQKELFLLFRSQRAKLRQKKINLLFGKELLHGAT